MSPPEVKVTKPKDPALEELRNIGTVISKAVLAKDIDTLLGYDRPDMRLADDEDLRKTKRDLYCLLFDASCLHSDSRSVYDILRDSRKLGIKARDLGKWGDGFRYADLLFFDRSKVSEKMLRSSKFLCAQQGKAVVSWTFKWVNGKWESAFPMFDSGTEGLCPE